MAEPKYLGPLEGAATGEVGNPACGDVLRFHVRLEGDVVEAAGFESLGSPYQLATASILCDCILGGTVAEARERGPGCVLEKLPDLPERNRYLARLAIEALQLALDAALARSHGTPGDIERRNLLDDDEAQAWVCKRLVDGPQTTAAVEQAARESGVLLPISTAKTLARLAAAGVLVGTLSMEEKAWVWEVNPQGGANSRAGGPPEATP